MQDCDCKVNIRKLIREYWCVLVIVVLTPLFLDGVLRILPTHDDWTSTCQPDFNPFFIKERFLFYGYHWRPFDSILGYLVGRNPQLLFPALNHYVVVTGHLLCAGLIFRVLSKLGFSQSTKNIVTVACFILPATMAAATAVDGMNQIYALAFGMIAFLLYIRQNRWKYVAWISTVFIASWWKENGLMWALICPILAYGFNIISLKTFKKDVMIGMGIMLVYALAVVLLPKDIIIHPEYVPSVMKIVKNVVKFLFTSFITVDYIYLLHEPSRNLWAAALSLLLTVPFCYYLYQGIAKLHVKKELWCSLLCLVIAAGPHLLTVFSMMHTYAGLALLAVLMALAIDADGQQEVKAFILSFLLFCCSSLIIDRHLIDESIKSSLVGKQMAQEAVKKTKSRAERVYLIRIEDDYPKLSSFCVIPYEAFGWGLASRMETNFEWPEVIEEASMEPSKDALSKAKSLAHDELEKGKYDCVWIVDFNKVYVVNQ